MPEKPTLPATRPPKPPEQMDEAMSRFPGHVRIKVAPSPELEKYLKAGWVVQSVSRPTGKPREGEPEPPPEKVGGATLPPRSTGGFIKIIVEPNPLLEKYLKAGWKVVQKN